MPKDDLVGCFRSGSSQSDAPDSVITRETARLWRDEGRGHFCRNGTMFQLDRQVVVDEELLVRSFVRVQDKLRKPKPLHYPIPALADHRIRWLLSFMTPEQKKLECF